MTASSTKDILAQMARYHAWATEGLLASIAIIPDEPYRKPCGLFFGSIHGTLNHLLLTDSQIWFPRFKSEPAASLPLDAEVEHDRAALAARLVAATARWPEHVAGLDEAALAEDLRYTMTTGQPRVLPRPAALLHVFNHATHHRGQITAGMTMLGFEFQPLDLPYLVFSELA